MKKSLLPLFLLALSSCAVHGPLASSSSESSDRFVSSYDLPDGSFLEFNVTVSDRSIAAGVPILYDDLVVPFIEPSLWGIVSPIPGDTIAVYGYDGGISYDGIYPLTANFDMTLPDEVRLFQARVYEFEYRDRGLFSLRGEEYLYATPPTRLLNRDWVYEDARFQNGDLVYGIVPAVVSSYVCSYYCSFNPRPW